MNDDFLIKPTSKEKLTPEPASAETLPPLSDEEQPSTGGNEALDMSAEPDQPDEKGKSKKTKKKRRSPKQWFLDLTKKQKILFIVAMVLLLGAIVAGAVIMLGSDETTPSAKKVEVKKVKATTEASRLTGVQVSFDDNKRGVTGVMVENSEVARPQSGLLEAGVVFEAKAEAGITRFLVLYQEGQPTQIGPVRSVRPHYVDWVQGFDAPLAHAGGSTDGLAKIKNDRVRDLDHGANGATFERVNFQEAPHNLYTSAAKLDALKASKGYSTSTFKGFPRKKDKPAKTPTASTIHLNITNPSFSVHYDYDKTTNTYKRSVGGAPHTDRVSGKQLAPKVVIANVMVNNRGAGSSSNYVTIGSGKTYIFQDGIVTEGTWEKASSTDQMLFKDARGNEIKLNAGQTWISAVEAPTDVAYTAPAPTPAPTQ